MTEKTKTIDQLVQEGGDEEMATQLKGWLEDRKRIGREEKIVEEAKSEVNANIMVGLTVLGVDKLQYPGVGSVCLCTQQRTTYSEANLLTAMLAEGLNVGQAKKILAVAGKTSVSVSPRFTEFKLIK